MASVSERSSAALARLLGRQVLIVAVVAVVLLLLYGAVPTGRVAWLLLLFVAVRGLMLVQEAIRPHFSADHWEQRYRALLDQFRDREPEDLESLAAKWRAEASTPEKLAQVVLDAQRRSYRPPRSGRLLTAEALGLITFCLVAPFDLALYTRELVSLRSSYGYFAFVLAALCVVLYAWPHRWNPTKSNQARQVLWWTLPAVPALALAYTGIATHHPYLDPLSADRLELRANRVLSLENNVVAGAHADWVFEYARELARAGEVNRAIYYYEEGLHLAPHSDGVRVRLAALRPGSSDPRALSGPVVDPRPDAEGRSATQLARLGFWAEGARVPIAQKCQIDESLAEVERTTIVLLRAGDVPTSMIDAVADVIQRELGVPVCAVPEAIPLPDASRVRGVVFGRQWSVQALAQAIFEEIPPDLPNAPLKFMLVTPVDIYSPGSNFVYSSTYTWGSVISYARYGDLASDPIGVRHQTSKQALAAVVKSFGVPPSTDPNCVTSYADGPAQFERKGNRPNLASFTLFRERVDAIDTTWQSTGRVDRKNDWRSAFTSEEKTETLALRKAASQGDAIAQRKLGHGLMSGNGMPRDPTEGIFWIREAAEQGDAEAQMYLGSSYARGDGVSKDARQAESWLRLAADQGHLLAYFQLATVYHAQRRWDEALEALRYAADRDQPDAQLLLATLYREGRVLPVDLETSVQWLMRAAEQGSANAQNNLGMALSRGDGIAKDPARAVVWFEKAARQGQVNAQFSLAYAYLNGSGVDRDPTRGLAWLEIAAAIGFERAIEARDSIRAKLPGEMVSDARRLARELVAESRRSANGV